MLRQSAPTYGQVNGKIILTRLLRIYQFFVSPEQRFGRDYAITFSVRLYVCDTLVKVFV